MCRSDVFIVLCFLLSKVVLVFFEKVFIAINPLYIYLSLTWHTSRNVSHTGRMDPTCLSEKRAYRQDTQKWGSFIKAWWELGHPSATFRRANQISQLSVMHCIGVSCNNWCPMLCRWPELLPKQVSSTEKSAVILFSSCNDEMLLNSAKTVFAASIQQLQRQRDPVPVHAKTNSPVVFLLKWG